MNKAEESKFRMIDVGEKAPTRRRALAEGWFLASAGTLKRIEERRLPKGDALLLAEVAGINGAKQTATLLPLCHPLALESVRLTCTPCGLKGIRVQCEVWTTGKTGVEMEALAGVMAALLCIYDLTKVIDPALVIGEVKLLVKEGGKSGVWHHPGTSANADSSPSCGSWSPETRCGVLTVSDSASRGEADDRSGPLLEKRLNEAGILKVARGVVADERAKISAEIARLISGNSLDLLLCTGGTGVAPRDVTPEAIDGREIPGIGELLRSSGALKTPMSWASRSGGWCVGRTLVIALPGSPKACEEGWRALEPILPHLLEVAAGVQAPAGHAPRKELPK